MRVVIIGGIAAGMSAAAKLKRADKEAEVIVYEKQDYISFGACGLPYYVGDFFEEKERMIVRTKQQMEAKGINVFLRHEVIKVEPKKKSVLVRDLETGELKSDTYDRLMIATGARALIPPIANVELKNVHVLRSLEDGQAVKEQFMRKDIKSVGIIGAGFIGLELVEAAKKLGKDVHLFQKQDRIMPSVFDKEITDLLEEELKAEGVHLYLNSKITGLEGTETVEKIVTENEIVSVDVVILAAGVRPNTEFLEGTGINLLENGAVIIDGEGKTSVEDIFAAGDCATVPHRLKSEPAYIPLATTANKLGRIVGVNLAGGKECFEGTLGSSCVKVLGLEAGRTGLSEEEARKNGYNVKTTFITDKNHTDYYPGQEKISVKIVYEADSKRILGGQMVGRDGAVLRTDVIAAMIYGTMTTRELGMLDLCYAPPFSRTWDVLNIAGNASV